LVPVIQFCPSGHESGAKATLVEAFSFGRTGAAKVLDDEVPDDDGNTSEIAEGEQYPYFGLVPEIQF